MIREELKQKEVLFIPVFSMRSYETGKYKLNCDGNMARVLSMIYNSGVKCAYITIPMPKNLDETDFANLKLKLKNKGMDKYVKFLSNSGYGENAKATRHSKNILKSIRPADYDVIVTEPQMVTYDLIHKHYLGKLIYWCVASQTISYSPWFTEEFRFIDKEIAANIPTACATDTQVQYLEGLSYKDEFYNSEFSDMKIIFFPFRLSDPSYKFDTLKEMVKKLKSEGIKNFQVIVTDPNQSGDFSNTPEILLVPSNAALYISILKGKPIIPYFENANEIKHISIEEMAMYKCEIVCYDNNEIPKGDNVHTVINDREFYLKLKSLLS